MTTAPTGPSKPLDFFVYVLESPSAVDLYSGRSEGALIGQALQLDNIQAVIRVAINRETLNAGLTLGINSAMKAMPGRLPILHLSAHGSAKGIQLSSGEAVSWADLRSLLLPINASLGGGLLLCMSACEGYFACTMAMELDDVPHPFLAMIGSHGKPTWSDTAVAYQVLYHLIAKGAPIKDAVKVMNAASGTNDWLLQTAVESKQGYLEHLAQSAGGAQAAQARLESVAETATATLSPEAKALEPPPTS